LISLPHATKVLFVATSVTFLFVPQISGKPLNGFAHNSQGRSVLSLAWTSLDVNVKDQGYQGQKMCLVLPLPAGSVQMACARCKQRGTAAAGKTPLSQCWLPRGEGSDFGSLRSEYVW